MTDSLYSTEKIVHETDIAIRAVGYSGPNAHTQMHLLQWRNIARTRAEQLERRLTNADAQYPHGPLDGMPHTDFYLDLLHEYEQAHDAMTRAHTALTQ